MTSHAKGRILHLGALLASGFIAASTAFDLADYQVPIPLRLVCALAVFCVLSQATRDLVERVTEDRFACEDCDFAVVVGGADAGEVARWRETASDHPAHRIDR